MTRDPTFRALALAAVLVAVWVWRAPINDYRDDVLKLERHGWSRCADVAVIGDSSVRYVVRPDQVEQQLPGYRVVNFGFLETAIASPKLMAATEAVLDGKGAVVIEASAWNLASIKQGRFEAELRDLDGPVATERDWRGELDLRLKTRGLCTMLWNACPWHNGFQLGYNGLLRIDTSYRDETFFAPWAERQLPAGVTFDVDGAAKRIRELASHGIAVFAYVERPRPAIAEITGARGFDPDSVERALAAAGATIIPYPTDLTTTDGLHLDPDSANRWSRAIGTALAAKLPPRAKPVGRCAWPEVTP